MAQDKNQSASFKVMINGQEQGPFNLVQLKQMIQTGQITRNTMVWQEGMSGWSEAEQVPELIEILKSAPSVQPGQSADTMKVVPEKKVKVKNAYYYKKMSRIHRWISAPLIVFGGYEMISWAVGGGTDNTLGYVYGGILAVGIIEFTVSIILNSHAKKLAKKEAKVTLSPARTGIGLALNF